jgi:hypothetical protein
VSQTGYLVTAFAVVVAVLIAWAGIIALKVIRMRRDAASSGRARDGGNG